VALIAHEQAYVSSRMHEVLIFHRFCNIGTNFGGSGG